MSGLPEWIIDNSLPIAFIGWISSFFWKFIPALYNVGWSNLNGEVLKQVFINSVWNWQFITASIILIIVAAFRAFFGRAFSNKN